MSHEEPQVARRSASQSTLNVAHALPTRTSTAISDSGHHLVPYFKPLRSIREHGHTFLDPAASADGMLRKTTETGNIGLFSINSGRPTPLRPRASLGDLRQPHRPISRSSDRPPGHDDRKRLPSYRDSTSEIISMYGSDNQSSSKSASGTLSPPWDDSGPRSYSMTTCGSKSYIPPRNNAIQLVHDAQLGAQRPRSPYPYPTRLPRLGIRPSSPALTENGIVDYSRMVEIDRVPQRTVHHPHKTLFPYKTMRDQPGPLSMRYGVNQSTRSLSDDRDPAHPFPRPMPRRPPLPTHLHPWGLRPRDRLGSGSSEQSLRTVSLSSTSGGYARAPEQIPNVQVSQKRPPIFYDYSEDFEDAVDPPPDFPIANPTPTRISKSFRPGFPDDGCDTRSESADEGVENVVDYLRRVTMIESSEHDDRTDRCYELEHYRPVSQLHHRKSPAPTSSYESIDQPLTSSPVLPHFMHTVGSSEVSAATTNNHQSTQDFQTNDTYHTTESLQNGLMSEVSRTESPLDTETPRLDVKIPVAEPACYDDKSPTSTEKREQNEGAENHEAPLEVLGTRMRLTKPAIASSASATLPYRYSCGHKDSRFFSLSSGLSDLASFVKYVDKHMQALDADDAEQHDTLVSGSRSEPRSPDYERQCDQTVPKRCAPPRTSSLAYQKRDNLGRMLNPPALVDEIERYQVISTRSGPTLVPQPISPVKMLRVKNSIPQLMKALPPLPGYSPASESPFNPTIVPIEFEPFEFSRLTDARSTLIEPFGSESHGEQTNQGYDPFVFDRAVRKPRLKLKNATSFTSGNLYRPRPGYLVQADATRSETSERTPSTTGAYDSSTAPMKRRLPIKISRHALDSVASEDSGTVKRRPRFDKSSTVSELASSPPVDLFSTSTNLGKLVQNTGCHPSKQSSSSDKGHETILVVNSPLVARNQQVTVIDDGRGVSLDTHLDALHSPKAKTEAAAEDEIQSFFSDSLVRPRLGLRKKLSNLRSRLTESRHHQYSSTLNVVAQEPRVEKGRQSDTEDYAPSGFKDIHTETSSTKDHHTVTPTRTVRSKWGKLVQGAKQRLRTWGKNRHKNE